MQNNSLCDGNWFSYDGFSEVVNITLLGLFNAPVHGFPFCSAQPMHHPRHSELKVRKMPAKRKLSFQCLTSDWTSAYSLRSGHSLHRWALNGDYLDKSLFKTERFQFCIEIPDVIPRLNTLFHSNRWQTNCLILHHMLKLYFYPCCVLKITLKTISRCLTALFVLGN